MALSYGPSIITDGLVLALDAADPMNYNLTAVEVLVVAGGGSGGGYGGNDGAGGGGAGGLIYNSNFTVTPGSALTVTVGAGGAGVGGATRGNNGGNSVFGSLTAIGGGGGGTEGALNDRYGSPGGSGGGGGGYGGFSGGSGTSGQGFKGGDCTAPGDGGGGGAGGEGSNGLTGNGGPGLGFNISGTFTYYAGGGGASGDRRNSRGSSGGIGGTGGGGNGQSANIGSSLPANYNATANTGGGGGGAAGSNATWGAGTTYTSGAGGSGIVIVRYPGPQRAIGGTVTSSGGHTIHTFTTVGNTTFTPLVATNNSTILGLADFSGNNNFGITVNSPVYSSANTGSMSFYGTNDWFSTPLSSIGDANTSFTWGGFVKVNASTTSNFFLFGNYTENFTTPFFAIAFNNSGTNTFIYIRGSGGDGQELLGTSKSLSLNNWYYIIGVRDAPANQVKLYVNGVLECTDGFTGSYSVKSSTNNFGGLRHLTNYLNANVSSVVVYNRALTATEIQQNFNALRGRFGI